QLGSSDVIGALEDAAARGVRVRVILDGQQTQNGPLVAKLKAAGVQAQLSSPQFTYTHQKTLVADRRTALIFTGNFDNLSFTRGRNDGALHTAGQDIDALEALSEADWSGAAPALDCPRLVVSPVNSKGRVLDVIAAARKSLDVEALYITDADIVQALIDA